MTPDLATVEIQLVTVFPISEVQQPSRKKNEYFIGIRLRSRMNFLRKLLKLKTFMAILYVRKLLTHDVLHSKFK